VFDGTKRFQSLASQADILFFSAVVEGRGLGLFCTALRNEPRIRVGATVASGFLADTDTRSLTFDGLELLEDQALSVGDGPSNAGVMHLYSRAWFQALVAAPYLGAAAETLRFAAADARTRAAGQPDVRAASELGRLALQVQAGVQLSYGAEAALASLARGASAAAAVADFDRAAQAIKYHGTRLAGEVVRGARESIGLRGMIVAPGLVDASHGVLFGPLHPNPNAQIEADFGAALLAGAVDS
jgi:alkylation response protein AidB-like acyl-CoA dehydrogenase